jgi:ribosomal protein L37AE/L43A
VVDRDPTRAELIAQAAPPCHECGEPIVRTEMPWRMKAGAWCLGQCVMVCAAGHRVPVEPFEETK